MKTIVLFSLLLLTGLLSAQTEKGATPLETHHSSIIAHHATRVVVAGISQYQSAQLPPTPEARRNAMAAYTWLLSAHGLSGGNLREDQIALLTDTVATLARLTNALGWLVESVQEGDIAIVYLAGQVRVEANTNTGEPYLLTHDSPPFNFGAGAFSASAMARIIRMLAEEKKCRVMWVMDLYAAGKHEAETCAKALHERLSGAGGTGIISCRPVSADQQQNAGPGPFTRHLLEGLYGLADRNQDAQVRFGEIQQYFEQRQFSRLLPVPPLWWGNADAPLANTQPEYLKKLRFYQNTPSDMGAQAAQDAAERAALSRIPEEKRPAYSNFRDALTRNDLLDPPGYCAWDQYELLVQDSAFRPLYNYMRRTLCTALQDEAQQALNALLSDDPYEINNWHYNAEKYHLYPEYLGRSLQLLGTNHYLKSAILAKKYYFEAYNLTHNNPEMIRSPAAAAAVTDLAKSRLKEAMAMEPDAAYLCRAMGDLYFDTYSLDSFLYYETCAIDLSPTWMMPYLDITHKYMWIMVDLNMAEHWITRALAIKPDSYAALEKRAWIHQWHFDMPKAIETCRQMIELRPDLNNGYSTLANIFLTVKNYDMAERYAREAIRLNPNLWWWSYRDLSVTYLQTRRYAQGVAHIERALERSDVDAESKTRLLESLAEGQIQYGQYADAEKSLARQAKLASAVFGGNNADREALRGKIKALTGQYAEADSILQYALTLDSTPNNYFMVAYIYLGVSAQETGRHDAARDYFEKAVAYTTTSRLADHEYIAEAYYRYGCFRLERGEKKAAKTLFRQAARLDPGNYIGYYGLALAYARQGKNQSAMDYLERALLRYFPEPASIEREPAFDKIRNKARFKRIMQHYFSEKSS